jgi:hypothetical protein
VREAERSEADVPGGYNAPRMERSRIWPVAGAALFVFYCTAVGVYLTLRPWSPGARISFGLGASPFFRGFVSGLGLVHLVAALADLRFLSRNLAAEPSAEPRP